MALAKRESFLTYFLRVFISVRRLSYRETYRRRPIRKKQINLGHAGRGGARGRHRSTMRTRMVLRAYASGRDRWTQFIRMQFIMFNLD